MRPGVFVSIIGHLGFIMMTLMMWPALRSALPAQSGAVVPVEIVDVAAESNVRALAEDVPDQEVAPSEQEPTEAQPEPTPAPAPPAQRVRPRPSDEFDLSAVAGLLDKQRDPGRQRTQGERADRNRQGTGLGTAEVAALEDRVRALNRRALTRCWRMPADLPDPERLVVTVQFELDRNGQLRGQPRVTSPTNYTFDPVMQQAANAALRAVRSCDFTFFPNDPVVGQRYDAWDDLDFTFAIRNN
jgi:hypothetical protein